MRKYFYCCIIIFALISMGIKANNIYQKTSKPIIKKDAVVFAMPDTSVTFLTRGANGLIVMPPSNYTPLSSNILYADTMFYNQAFLPVIFEGKILPANLDFISKDSSKIAYSQFHLIDPQLTFIPQLERRQKVSDLRRYYYTNYPENITVTTSSLAKYSKVRKEEQEVIKKSVFQDLITADTLEGIHTPTLEKYVPMRRYWEKKGVDQLQVSQNAISHNWSGGGISNFTIISYHQFTANYKKDKVSFNNMLEWRLNFQNATGDSLRQIQINDDYFHMTNDFGYQAYKNWSYSANTDIRTPIFRHYDYNTNNRTMAFLSPLTVNVGVGIRNNYEKIFQSDKYKKITFGINLSPISLNMTYVGDKEIPPSRYGIVKPDKRSKIEYGSTINSNFAFNFNRYTAWTSRLKYFTNYSSSYCEFENNLNMAINRYFSTTVYLYLIFDDTNGRRDGSWGYLQRNERISFGLNYNW